MGKTAFIFPGQGSQFVGMGLDFYNRYQEAANLYHTADEQCGYKLSDISFQGPEEYLKQTQNTQPALYVLSHIIARLLGEKGVKAEAAAGHSLGEFSALAAAGAFSFEQGLAIVKERGLAMQKAGDKSPGAMAAIIGLDEQTVQTLCEEAGDKGVVQPANFNSPGQIVISGAREAVQRGVELAKKHGAKIAALLPVSGAFHSPLMADALGHFSEVLDSASIQDLTIPVYANVSAAPVKQADEIRGLLQQQLTQPVRWMETIENMIRDGFTRFIEVGAGKVLSGLVKRIDRRVEMINCGTVDALEKF
ncbi:MAG TPA: [acyl-carrier-protein] S-malonyltransferase [bacterium]|nr:[acyl-carrier-protein] S-malonyltransferase [bacterium]